MRYFYATLVAVIFDTNVKLARLLIVNVGLSYAFIITFWYNILPFVEVKQNEFAQLYTLEELELQYDLLACISIIELVDPNPKFSQYVIGPDE